MNNKGFEADINLDETPNLNRSADEPLKTIKNHTKMFLKLELKKLIIGKIERIFLY